MEGWSRAHPRRRLPARACRAGLTAGETAGASAAGGAEPTAEATATQSSAREAGSSGMGGIEKATSLSPMEKSHWMLRIASAISSMA